METRSPNKFKEDEARELWQGESGYMNEAEKDAQAGEILPGVDTITRVIPKNTYHRHAS